MLKRSHLFKNHHFGYACGVSVRSDIIRDVLEKASRNILSIWHCVFFGGKTSMINWGMSLLILSTPQILTWIPHIECLGRITQEAFLTHRIHVWYIYLHLVDLYGKCREIYHRPMDGIGFPTILAREMVQRLFFLEPCWKSRAKCLSAAGESLWGAVFFRNDSWKSLYVVPLWEIPIIKAIFVSGYLWVRILKNHSFN